MPIPQKLKEERAHFFEKMEQCLNEMNRPEDSLFFHHSSEDRVVLSHALFWVMTKSIGGVGCPRKNISSSCVNIRKKCLMLISQNRTIFRSYCNIIYETLSHIFRQNTIS